MNGIACLVLLHIHADLRRFPVQPHRAEKTAEQGIQRIAHFERVVTGDIGHGVLLQVDKHSRIKPIWGTPFPFQESGLPPRACGGMPAHPAMRQWKRVSEGLRRKADTAARMKHGTCFIRHGRTTAVPRLTASGLERPPAGAASVMTRRFGNVPPVPKRNNGRPRRNGARLRRRIERELQRKPGSRVACNKNRRISGALCCCAFI